MEREGWPEQQIAHENNALCGLHEFPEVSIIWVYYKTNYEHGRDSMKQKALGRRIREERLKLNLTQEKLAEDVDLSMAYIGQIERGERSLTLDNLVAVANRLGVTVDYLLSDSIAAKDDAEYLILRQLLNGRTKEERALAVNMVKLMFGYLDRSL